MNKVISAIRGFSALEMAVKSNVSTIFYLAPNINTISEIIEMCRWQDKKLYIHMDMAEGIGKDKYGIGYVKDLGVDGILSTRTNIIKAAKEAGLSTVQRFFAIDSYSVNTIIETLRISKPDYTEIMPGIAYKVIEKVKAETNIPIIAGGLVETREEMENMLSCGALAVSTGKRELWG